MLYNTDIASVIEAGLKIHATDKTGNKFIITTKAQELYVGEEKVYLNKVNGTETLEGGLTENVFALDKGAIENIYYALTRMYVAREKARMAPVVKYLLEKYPLAEAYELKDIRCQEKHKGCVIVVPCPLEASINKKPDRLSGYMLDQDNLTTLNYETVAEWRFTNKGFGLALDDFNHAFVEARNKRPE